MQPSRNSTKCTQQTQSPCWMLYSHLVFIPNGISSSTIKNTPMALENLLLICIFISVIWLLIFLYGSLLIFFFSWYFFNNSSESVIYLYFFCVGDCGQKKSPASSLNDILSKEGLYSDVVLIYLFVYIHICISGLQNIL